MLIRVLCSDKTAGHIEDSALEDFNRKGVVVAFYLRQSNEWVDVRNGRVRKKETNTAYKGPERRKIRGK